MAYYLDINFKMMASDLSVVRERLSLRVLLLVPGQKVKFNKVINELKYQFLCFQIFCKALQLCLINQFINKKTLSEMKLTLLFVQFDEPQNGVAPGQAVVCYDGDQVLGGGWID